MPDTPARVEFLKKSHLFQGLSDKELVSVAETMKENTYQNGETVFAEGTPADSFYIIFRGRMLLTRRVKDREVKVASLFQGDYFGERGLLKGTIRNATVKSEGVSILLIFYRDDFKKLLTRVPHLWENFDLMMDSRKLAGELNFPWLAENEVIYFLARKHYFLLVRALVLPVLALIPALAVLVFGFLLNSIGMAAVGAFATVLVLGWAGWRYLDWGNDFYIVTNQRVVWLEKVIGLYDSRQEAPMSTILSINTESDYFGRQFFDYGTVVVRTFTGQIRMTFVRHPKQAAAMIEEYWNRTKVVARQLDEDIIKNAIRNKLGIKKPGAVPAAAPAAPSKPLASKENPLYKMWREAFNLRSESGGTVTYRKHWIVLLRDTLPQTGGILLALVVLIGYPFIFGAPPLWLVLISLLVMTALAGWWFYGFEDWQNDIYQVTNDQIIDVYKKPFGVEDRKAAPLDGILSSEYKRNGLVEIIFNYGTVYIMVGGANFDFEDVADPPTVQQDIIRRLAVKMQKKREADGAAERDKMAEWLAYYHKTIKEIEDEQKQARASGDSG